MKKIGLLSDTHGAINPRVTGFLADTDEIWHAGDIGDEESYNSLAKLKPLKAVYGNIDDRKVRILCPETMVFMVEQVKVAMIHIGGYPGAYDNKARLLIEKERPKLFVCGHSHILRVMYDKKYDMLVVNPGAAGNYGFHKSITAVRFVVHKDRLQDMEVLDIPRK
jgi:uncharacterized protein